MNTFLRQPGRFIRILILLILVSLSAGNAAAQSGGPPPIPPIPDNVWNFYPLESPPWADMYGFVPRASTNLATAPSWDYDATALSVDTNVPAFLQFNYFEDGYPAIEFSSGSVALWAQVNWTSVADGGTGPTNWAVLFSIGNWTSNAAQSAWTLAIDPAGTNLVMEAQASGSNQMVFKTPVDLDEGDWHYVTITYSPSNSWLYLEGQPVGSNGPILFQPSLIDCTNYGFFVGSLSTGGIDQVHGQIQWLATYDYPLASNEVASAYAAQSAYITYWGGSLPSGGFHSEEDPPAPGGGDVSTNYSGGGLGDTNGFAPPGFMSSTNYADYAMSFMTISNVGGYAHIAVQNCLSNLTYVIYTNSDLSNSNGWAIWQTNLATNSVIITPAIEEATNALFFTSALVLFTGTNSLPDYWCMEYFRTLNVNPFADPDGDGLCNLDEFTLGLNPTNAHTLSSLHNDAQALVLAYTNSTGCVYHLTITNGPDTNTLLVTISPTLVGTNYQIYSQACTNCAWIVETNFLGTGTNTTVAMYLNGRTLSLVGGYGEDSDGDSLPDDYEVLSTHTDPYLPDTGISGVGDAYKDPDGDGYINIVEYYNGTDPLVFDTPAGPQNAVVDPGTVTNTYNLSWQPAGGSVTGYIISVYNYTTGVFDIVATNTATQMSYVLSYNPNYDNGGQGILWIYYSVQAIYAGGDSFANNGYATPINTGAQAALVHGPGGKTCLILSGANTNALGYNIGATFIAQDYPEVSAYYQYYTPYPTSISYSVTNTYIPASQFTNGIAVLTDEQAPPYVEIYYDNYLYPKLVGGGIGSPIWAPGAALAEPFIDGTAAMKQNVRFLLRAAGPTPFGFTTVSQNPDQFNSLSHAVDNPIDHVFSTYYFALFASEISVSLNHFQPFEDNYFYRNFVFDSGLIDSSGNLDTGFENWDSEDFYLQTNITRFEFPTYDYVTSSNGVSIPGILASNETSWVGYFGADISDFGAYTSGSYLAMSNGAKNVYGLPYTSLELTRATGTGVTIATLSPGNNVSNSGGFLFYAGTAEPVLQTVGYLFATIVDQLPAPGNSAFYVTNTTQPIVGSVGNSLLIAGFAKQALLNGYSDVFAYLGQYFTNAFIVTNGVVSTNSAGILSEYGEFFPMLPGRVALFTKSDPDQTNIQGRCDIDIIRLSLDVNHDGIMDESFTGPDNTSSSAPYVFWANNDIDRWTYSVLDGSVEDDVDVGSEFSSSPYAPTLSVPDCEYRGTGGQRVIPCVRDLEDFSRLWVSGASNAISRLPAGTTATLSWQTGSGAAIDLFQAADSDGGAGYLTNMTTASNQINLSLCKYMGRIQPGSNIVLNATNFSSGWAGDHFVWCGVSNGIDQLNLTIADSFGNVLAQSSQWIQILDIKQMYERWSVGDNDKNIPITEYAPSIKPVIVEDGQPSFHYSYDPAFNTNDNYVLYVHGWNMESWEKDRFAETAYKRLYWQGYQGRFGIFRWPTTLLDLANNSCFDEGEWVAWKSAQALNNFLSLLSHEYSSKVYVVAHSMGNVVTGEALRLAGTNTIVNTYVASQAAISARIYDNTVPPDLTNSYGWDMAQSAFTSDAEGHYNGSNAPPYFSGIHGALNFVDFYNEGDWALRKWTGDQKSKPEHYYGYGSSVGYYFSDGWYVNRDLAFGTNTYEIFSQATKSYSFALGAETNVAFPFTSFPSVNLATNPFNFPTTHPGHSEQFRFDNMTAAIYWRQLLVSFGIQ